MKIEIELKRIDPGDGNTDDQEVLVLDKPQGRLEQIVLPGRPTKSGPCYDTFEKTHSARKNQIKITSEVSGNGRLTLRRPVIVECHVRLVGRMRA